MPRALPWIVVVVLLLLPRAAFALGWEHSSRFFHEAGTEIAWEHDKMRCRTYESTCFVLFPDATGRGVRASSVTRREGTPWVLAKKADGGTWVLFDARTQTLVLSTDDADVAAARYASLAGRAPRLLDAAHGEPSRPTLWRTPASLWESLTSEVPLMTLLWGIWLWPMYLAAMAAYVLVVWCISRRRGWRYTAFAAFTSPLVPFAAFAWLTLAFA